VLVYLQAPQEARLANRVSQKSGLMQGKRGAILGVANNRVGMKRPDAPDISLSNSLSRE